MVEQTYNENGSGVSVIQGAIIPHCDLCAEWSVVPRVMPKSQFVGWGTKGFPKNCFDYAWGQLKKAGFTMKSTGWGTVKKINPYIYQIFGTQAVGGINTSEQVSEHFREGVKYLRQALSAGIPVLVGVDDQSGSPNTDKVTDHFVIIVGMGVDDEGNYFLYDDNATSDIDSGTSDKNRLYCLCNKEAIIGRADEKNTYFLQSEYKSYRVTQIRESKVLK